jgi:hypothetical protein
MKLKTALVLAGLVMCQAAAKGETVLWDYSETVSGFVVYCREVGASDVRKWDIPDGEARSLVVTDLIPGSDYEFWGTAYNKVTGFPRVTSDPSGVVVYTKALVAYSGPPKVLPPRLLKSGGARITFFRSGGKVKWRVGIVGSENVAAAGDSDRDCQRPVSIYGYRHELSQFTVLQNIMSDNEDRMAALAIRQIGKAGVCEERVALLNGRLKVLERDNAVQRELISWAETLLCNSLPQAHCLPADWDRIVKNWRDQVHEK